LKFSEIRFWEFANVEYNFYTFAPSGFTSIVSDSDNDLAY
jgi:hypothetical protein